MNLPNKITVARIFVAVLVLLMLLFPWTEVGINFPQYTIDGNIIVDLKILIAGVLFVIGSFSDFLDGHIARSRNIVTDFGKVMDSIADKILVNPILIILACSGFIPVIIPVIIISRDICVDAIKMQASGKGKVQAAIKSGKYKTACMMLGITLVFFYNMPFEFFNIRIDLGLLFIACILSVISGIQYYSINKKYF